LFVEDCGSFYWRAAAHCQGNAPRAAGKKPLETAACKTDRCLSLLFRNNENRCSVEPAINKGGNSMNKKESWGIFSIVVVLGLAGAPAAAQDAGAYLGASLGTGESANACEGIVGTCDDKDTGYRLFGGYEMNRNLAWEIGYAYLGDVVVNGTDSLGAPVNFEATKKALDFSGIVTLPLSDRFGVFGRLGIYRSQAERRGTGVATGGSHNTSFTWGLGLRFDLARAIAVRAEWQHYPDIGGDAAGKDDVNLMTLGLVMRF
jgi:OOP family OmpA-OmpF porin